MTTLANVDLLVLVLTEGPDGAALHCVRERVLLQDRALAEPGPLWVEGSIVSVASLKYNVVWRSWSALFVYRQYPRFNS